MNAPALLVAVLLVALAGGCARSHLFYNATELRHSPIETRDVAAIDHTVMELLGDRTVTWIDVGGRERRIASDEIDKLGVAERGALWLALSTGEVGGEQDVRVHVGARSSPVSVYVALDGSVRVVSGRAGPQGAAPTLAAIRTRHNLDGELPGTWTDAERRALDESLASLAPAELAAMKDIAFQRQTRQGGRDPSRAALFEMKGCRATISLFPSGVQADAFRFVGDSRSPKSAVLHSIVHEMGHAFEQQPARAKYCAAARAKASAADELIRAGNELAARSPVLEEYQRVLAGKPGPTDYGNTSLQESFAESFALFHVDPAALQRALPQVHAWFVKGQHMNARRQG